MSSKLPKMFQVGRRDRWMVFVFGIFFFSLILTFHYFWESIPVPLPNGVTWTHAPEGNSGAVEPPLPPPPPPPPGQGPDEHIPPPPPGQGPDEHSPPPPPPPPEHGHEQNHDHELDPELAPVPPITDIIPARPIKPDNITVSGLIFYGRKDRVRCMRCYLERNLVENGGWLDEVLWIVNTDNEKDLEYLNEIIASNPKRYRAVIIPGEKLWVYTYWKAWRHLERGKYYVKIDDDIVWIDDDAIPKMVTRKMEHPDDLVVSANIINNPPLGFMHYHMGAIHPYFPELKRPENSSHDWRPSAHPFWEGPINYRWKLDADPPQRGHRWLRVRDDKRLPDTPASELKYDVWGDSYSSWAIATQMHYSLLENIESDTLDLYKFKRTWDMAGERIRINFMCIYSDDILDTKIDQWPKDRGDEDMLVLELPKKLRRPVVILGDALGAHFQYSDQGKLGETDLLARYQALADEEVCVQQH